MNWPKQRIGDGLRYDTDGGSDMIMLRIMKLIKKTTIMIAQITITINDE